MCKPEWGCVQKHIYRTLEVGIKSNVKCVHDYCFSKSNVQLDPKEQLRLEKLVDESGFIKRDEFVEFAKKSSSVKDFNLRGSRSSTPVGRREIDKAEVVFRVTEFKYHQYCLKQP